MPASIGTRIASRQSSARTPLRAAVSTVTSRTSVASNRPIVAVRAVFTAGLATTERHTWSGLSGATRSTEPLFSVGSLRSSCQPSRSTMTTRIRSRSNRHPDGGSKQRRTVRVSPTGARARISGDTSVLDSGATVRTRWSSANQPGLSGSTVNSSWNVTGRCSRRSVSVASVKAVRAASAGKAWRGTANTRRPSRRVAGPRQPPIDSAGSAPLLDTRWAPATSTITAGSSSPASAKEGAKRGAVAGDETAGRSAPLAPAIPAPLPADRPPVAAGAGRGSERSPPERRGGTKRGS